MEVRIPDVAAPFTGVQITPTVRQRLTGPIRASDLAGLQSQLRKSAGRGGLDPDEVTQALVGAMHRDRELGARPEMRAQGFVAMMAYLFAFLVGLGVRITEALEIRWCEINWELGFVVIHQAKVHSNKRGKPKPDLRIAPLQDALVPWLRELARLMGVTNPEDCEDYIFATDLRLGGKKRALENTIIARAKKVLEYAGVDPGRYATHWGRATHISWAKHDVRVKAEEVQHFVGHAAFDGTSEDYVTMLTKLLRPEHRRYIPLPSPDEVLSRMGEFKPQAYDWREWRSHSKGEHGPSGRKRWQKKK